MRLRDFMQSTMFSTDQCRCSCNSMNVYEEIVKFDSNVNMNFLSLYNKSKIRRMRMPNIETSIDIVEC